MHDCGFQLLGRFSEQAAAASNRLRVAMGLANAATMSGKASDASAGVGGAHQQEGQQQLQQQQEEEGTVQAMPMAEGAAADVDMSDAGAAAVSPTAGATLQAAGAEGGHMPLPSPAAVAQQAAAPEQQQVGLELPAAASGVEAGGAYGGAAAALQQLQGYGGRMQLQQGSLASPVAATSAGGGKRKVPAAAADASAAFYTAWQQTCLQGYDPRNPVGQVLLCKLMTALLSATHPHSAATTAAAYTAAAAAAATSNDPNIAAANATAAAMQAAIRAQMGFGSLVPWGDQNMAYKKRRMSGEALNAAGMDGYDGSSPSGGMSWLSSPAVSGLTAPAAAAGGGAGEAGVSSRGLECEVDGGLSMESLLPHVAGDAARQRGGAGSNPRGSIQEQALLALLAHACTCTLAACPHNPSCQKLRGQLAHLAACGQKVSGGCGLCAKLMRLLGLHARSCADATCMVPNCR
jgi:hypothetical protein